MNEMPVSGWISIGVVMLASIFLGKLVSRIAKAKKSGVEDK